MKLKYDGKEIEFEEFPIDYDNTVKIRVHDNEKDGEGCWAFLSNADMEKYEDDSCEDVLVAVLANDLLHFYPEQSFGMFIPVKCMGNNRPECDLSKFDMTMKIYHSKKDEMID